MSVDRIILIDWNYCDPDLVRLSYSDDSILFVRKSDFDRVFGYIISADKSAIVRDFSIT